MGEIFVLGKYFLVILFHTSHVIWVNKNEVLEIKYKIITLIKASTHLHVVHKVSGHLPVLQSHVISLYYKVRSSPCITKSCHLPVLQRHVISLYYSQVISLYYKVMSSPCVTKSGNLPVLQNQGISLYYKVRSSPCITHIKMTWHSETLLLEVIWCKIFFICPFKTWLYKTWNIINISETHFRKWGSRNHPTPLLYACNSVKQNVKKMKLSLHVVWRHIGTGSGVDE